MASLASTRLRTPPDPLTGVTTKHDSRYYPVSPGDKAAPIENGGLQRVCLGDVPSSLALLAVDARLNGEPQSSWPLVPRIHGSPPKGKPDSLVLTHHPSQGALTLHSMTLGASEPTGPKPHPHTKEAYQGGSTLHGIFNPAPSQMTLHNTAENHCPT